MKVRIESEYLHTHPPLNLLSSHCSGKSDTTSCQGVGATNLENFTWKWEWRINWYHLKTGSTFHGGSVRNLIRACPHTRKFSIVEITQVTIPGKSWNAKESFKRKISKYW